MDDTRAKLNDYELSIITGLLRRAAAAASADPGAQVFNSPEWYRQYALHMLFYRLTVGGRTRVRRPVDCGLLNIPPESRLI